MHTLHYWAVQATSSQEAFEMVQSRLSPEEDGRFVEWSDWHVVGGGRWSDSQYDDSSTTVISYANDPEKFNEALARVKKWRIDEMNRYLEQINFDKFQSDMVDYISNSGIPSNERFDLNSYYFKKAGDMLMDYYTPESYFYDLVEYTAHLGYIQERLSNPDTASKQFLVPVDFHYQDYYMPKCLDCGQTEMFNYSEIHHCTGVYDSDGNLTDVRDDWYDEVTNGECTVCSSTNIEGKL